MIGIIIVLIVLIVIIAALSIDANNKNTDWCLYLSYMLSSMSYK